MLTSLGEKLSADEMQAGGISACLFKPLRQSDLFNCLVNVMAGSTLVPAWRSAPAQGPTVPAERQSLRVLVAEDNSVNQRLAVRQMAKLGYSADAVANGLEVVEALERIPYDLILMDCQMPEMDGYEATREIRRREKAGSLHPQARRPLRIIALTADAMEGDRERCLCAGMDDYISKPVRLETLREVLARVGSARPPAEHR
jgi:CheY-like chemotaxis protein